MYHLIKSLDNKSKSLPRTILNKEENPITATAETLDRWAEHFKELLNRPTEEPVQSRHSATQSLATIGTTPPTFVEKKEAVHRLKNHKAAGTNNILPELYKHGGDSLTAALTELADMIWNQQAISSEWKTAIILPSQFTNKVIRRKRKSPGYPFPERCLQNLRKYHHRPLGPAYEEHAREIQAILGRSVAVETRFSRYDKYSNNNVNTTDQ